MMVRRLLEDAGEVNCEAAHLVDAIALVARRAGLRVSCLPETIGGQVRSSLRVWAAEDRPQKSIGLAWGGRYADGCS